MKVSELRNGQTIVVRNRAFGDETRFNVAFAERTAEWWATEIGVPARRPLPSRQYIIDGYGVFLRVIGWNAGGMNTQIADEFNLADARPLTAGATQ
jgi:hypothetical protein